MADNRPWGMDADWWNVTCERCPWRKFKVDTHDEAVDLGQAHSEAKHPTDYKYRVRGYKDRKKEGAR